MEPPLVFCQKELRAGSKYVPKFLSTEAFKGNLVVYIKMFKEALPLRKEKLIVKTD